MNKFTTVLQATALSLLLLGSAQASTHKTPTNKAAVVAGTTSAHHARAKHHESSSKPMTKVDINSADAATIHQGLLNIGPSKAAAIVAYRKQHGAFKSADQLASVKGIGLKTIEKNHGRIVVGTVAKR